MDIEIMGYRKVQIYIDDGKVFSIEIINRIKQNTPNFWHKRIPENMLT